jgi:hypothetical protein
MGIFGKSSRNSILPKASQRDYIPIFTGRTEFWKEHLNQVQTTVSYLLITSNVANYIESGIKKVEWLAANPDCEICSMNADVQVKIGKKFPSGHYFPPAHEECACDLAPVSEFDF